MKKRISILMFFLAMGTTLVAQQHVAAGKSNDCGGCNAPGSGIFAFKYITDNVTNYKITNCVPFSDIEMYSSVSGGSVVAYATSDEKGEALVSLPEKTTVAFALNHNRVNAKGISGKRQVYSLAGNPVLDIESLVLTAADPNNATVSWKANAFGAPWDFSVYSSVNGKTFEPVANVSSGSSAGKRSYTVKNEIAGSGGAVVYYRIEARNQKTGVVIQTGVKELTMPKPALFTATNFNNRVRVHFSNLVSYPATYSFTDVQGIKVGTGILKANDQVIDINAYQTQVYILSIIDSKNNTGSQQLLKH